MKIEWLMPADRSTLLTTLLEKSWYRVSEDGGLSFLVRFGRTESNRLVCTGLMVGVEQAGQEVTARSLREIRLGEVMGSWIEWQSHSEDEGFDITHLLGRIRMDWAMAGAEPITARPARPGPRGLQDSHYKKIAEAYRQALKDYPNRPIKAVAELWGREPVTIRRWISGAHKRGFLEGVETGPGSRKKPTDSPENGTR